MLALVDLLLPFRFRFYYNNNLIFFNQEDRYPLQTVAKRKRKGIEAQRHINMLKDLLTPIASSNDRLVIPEGQEDQEQ
jgi:hypothetical protein